MIDDYEHIALPPQSVESEQGLLGCLLLSNEILDTVATVVAEDDFYRREHQIIYKQIGLMVQAGKPADAVTVYDSLKGQDISLAYLGEMTANVSSLTQAKRYAEIIADKAKLRSCITTLNQMCAELYTPGAKSQEILDRIIGALVETAESSKLRDEPVLIRDALIGAMQRIEQRYENPGKLSGLATKFDDIDALTGGLQAGDLIIIGGRPSMGKTAMAINIAENVALEDDGSVLVFSIEMSGEQLAMRTMASVGGVSMNGMRDGKLSQYEWEGLSNAIGRLQGAPIYIDASPTITVRQMHAKARRLARKGKLSLVVIDYLQLVQLERNSANKSSDIGEATRALKLMAKDLRVPVICLSQLNRGLEQRADKRPVMSDLRESGAIEQDADLIAFMYREDYYNPETPLKGYAEFLVRKHRMGECGDIPLVFEGKFSRFRTADKMDYMHQRMDDEASQKPKLRGLRGE